MLQPLAQRLHLPYGVLLAAFGIALAVAEHHGAFVAIGQPGPGVFRLGSDHILYVFLPPLLFQAGLDVDVRRMLDDVAPILLLAIVAVFLCTFVVGLSLWAVTSGVALVLCLLVGAVIATTDPVAVIDIFRDVGAPRRLSILVEGESLFNDAAAIALYGLLLGTVALSRSIDVAEAASLFVTSFIGGAVLGWLAAHLAGVVLRPVRDIAVAETTITVVTAYLVFTVGQAMLGVSGVVAVVVAALVMGSNGRSRLSPESWRALQTVWAQLGHWAAALVFVLASMLVPRFLEAATPYELGLLVVVIVSAFAARALTLFGLLPLLTALGLAQTVRLPEKLVILWGGLRGALTLALALAVVEDPRLTDDEQQFVAMLATGFVLFTLFVNGITLRPMVHWLGLDRLAPMEQALRDRTVALVHATLPERLKQVARRYRVPDEVVADLQEAEAEEAATSDPAVPLSVDDQVRLGLATLATREEELYLHYFNAGTLARPVLASLLAKAGRLRDGAKTAGPEGYIKAAKDHLRFRLRFRLAHWLHRRLKIDGPLAARLADRFESLTTSRLVVHDLLTFSATRLRLVIGQTARTQVEELLHQRLDGSRQALDALRLQYPDYEMQLARRFLMRAEARLEEQEYRVLRDESVITPEIYHDLAHRIGARQVALSRRPRLDLQISTPDLVRGFSMFADLDEAALAEICGMLVPRVAVPDEVLVRKGERGDSMFFIASGAVEVGLPNDPVRLGRGDFFGELAIMTGRRRSSTVTAIAYCSLLVLSGRDFRRFAKTQPKLRARIGAVAAERRGWAPTRLPGSRPTKDMKRVDPNGRSRGET
ncbi:MAG: cation:proton antiporter [Rhodospirillaceae bacterium]|nr:cation:proton antiporter [Rhodospirillaceae bacterium]